MPEVRLLRPDGDVAADVEAPEGGRLLDLCDEHGLPVSFSCRGATCGMCRVDVEDGLERLAPAEDDERKTLATLRSPPHRRLACQVRIAPGPGLVVFRRADGR